MTGFNRSTTMKRFLLVLCTLWSSCSVFCHDLTVLLFGNRSITLLESFWPAPEPLILGDISINSIFRGEHGLLKRQEQCVDTGYLPCPNLPNYCCPAGEDCFPQGCCDSGYQPCGSRCYNPSSSVCCEEGYTCQEGYDCVGNDYCCPSGKQRCGSQTCYNPKAEKCCSDGSSCPSNYDCRGDGTCCPTGEQRCGNSKCYDPKTSTCCTGSGRVWACDIDEKCCTEGGASACYDPTNEQCCPGDSCDKESTCCGNECCGSSSTCGSDGYCTVKPRPTLTKGTSTPTAFGGGSETSPPSKKTIPFRYDPNRKVKGEDGKLYDAQNKAVLTNVCEDIQAALGYVSQSIELTRASDIQREANRKAMCPKGYCAKALKEYLKKFYPNSLPEAAQQAVLMAKDLQCDEFPFAISTQGGDPSKGTRICLPGPENSWQGGVMSNYFKDGGIQVGDNFTIQIDGFDCETLMPDISIDGPSKRDDVKVTNITGASLYQGYDPSNSNNKLLAMPLDDLDAGEYAVDVSVATGSLQFQVVTYDGTVIQSSNDGNRISFTLTEARDSVSVIGVTTDDDVQVSYDSKKVSDDTSSNGGPRGHGAIISQLVLLALVLSQLIIM